MADHSDSPAASGFNRHKFIAGAAGTAVVVPLTAKAAAPLASTIPGPDPSLPVENNDEDIREYMSGNICRCAA